MSSIRPSGRAADELRPVRFERGCAGHAHASAMACFGATRVLCTATVEDRVPAFLRGARRGWLTAEYGMLPCATATRTPREAARGRQGGRTLEIQRLIGRSLRACLNLAALGERTITIDCDVIEADGGTRTAAINGGYIALRDAVSRLLRDNRIERDPVHGLVSAVSVGIYKGTPVLDLDYAEDCEAETDMNIVVNDAGHFIEVQGTAEGHAFVRGELDAMLELAQAGTRAVTAMQRDTLAP